LYRVRCSKFAELSLSYVKSTQIDFSSLPDESDDFSIELVWREVLVSVGGGIEGESFVVQFDHDFSDCSFGEGDGLLLLDCHQFPLQHLQLIVEIHIINYYNIAYHRHHLLAFTKDKIYSMPFYILSILFYWVRSNS